MITPARPQIIMTRIEEYLRAHGPSDAVAVRFALKLNHGTASSQLFKGCEAGIFKRVGGAKNPGWIYDVGDGVPVAKPKPVAPNPERLTPRSYRSQICREMLGME